MQEMKTTILKGVALRLDEKDIYLSYILCKGTFFTHFTHSYTGKKCLSLS